VTYLSAGIVLDERDLARDINLLILLCNLLFVLGLRDRAIATAVVDHILKPTKLKGVSSQPSTSNMGF
jgi:hypothetical protein